MSWLGDVLITVVTIFTILTIVSIVYEIGRWVKRRLG